MEIDRKTLKALGAETRLDILKSLKDRRKTLSEMSNELNLAPSTVLEHLNKLEGADLIRREETGHKWIYYTLTIKGSNLVKPKVSTQFIIVIGLSVILVFGFIAYYSSNMNLMATAKPSLEKGFDEITSGVAPSEMQQNITQNITNSTTSIP